jgi:hypothetical protein
MRLYPLSAGELSLVRVSDAARNSVRHQAAARAGVKWCTEYRNRLDGGSLYSGPIVFADSLDEAVAILTQVRGPNEEMLSVTGRIKEMMIMDDDDDPRTVVHRSRS